MFTIGALGFTTPWLLLGLVALPILWLLLRAVPPAPIRRRFPGVALLLGLSDDDQQSDRTPWWLLLLRLLAVAAIILGFAGPVLNPSDREPGSGPLLILADGGWADARDWQRRQDRIAAAIDDAGRQGRPVAVLLLTDLPVEVAFQPAEAQAQRVPGLAPAPFDPDPGAAAELLAPLGDGFETLWLSDGLATDGEAELLATLRAAGPVTIYESPRPIFALGPARFEDGAVRVTVKRLDEGGELEREVSVIGLDPAGIERQLASAIAIFEAGETTAEVTLELPPELRNRVTRLALPGIRSAGAVSLTDDALQRREVALVSGQGDAEQLDLLDPLFYLDRALAPTADLIDGPLSDILLANPDVVILADVATLAGGERDGLLDWVEAGGLLVRFAGPRLASADRPAAGEDPLLPVRLRSGGRSVGGTMTWGDPKMLAPFPDGSPFAGLPVPDDVEVTAQVIAEPGPDLAERVIAQLTDGTPFVTRATRGQGQIVLFHVTANAEWSSVPLSGLFVQMLERLAISTSVSSLDAEELQGTTWVPDTELTAFGNVEDAGARPGVDGALIAEGRLGPDLMPGLYAGEDRRVALNVLRQDDVLTPAVWPDGVPVEGLDARAEIDLAGPLLALAVALLALDVIASLALSGRLRGPRGGAVAVLVAGLALAAPHADAQDAGTGDEAALDPAFENLAVFATNNVVLGHVLTGDSAVDETAEAGLRGLSMMLLRRTSIEPAAPVGIDIETDELSFYPFIYWPVVASAELPSPEASARINAYLRSGGMILFDTRDADIAGFGAASPEGQMLRAIARPLDIPALEPVPGDHVLTRTFYLLQDFPGRHASRDVWLEAAPADAVQAEGMPFRDLNDGVTPVIIGGNDWAAAWAMDERGQPLLPVGRGQAGERQREFAYRFGINLIMHVLTGNYKSDQVHVPDLLERLGQ